MSHIVQFRIEGLAGRPDPFEMKMDRGINVFFGPNGCGKTSLLKILHSAMSNDASALARVPFTSAEAKIYSLKFNQVFTRTISKRKPPQQSPSVEDATAIRIDEGGIIELARRERAALEWKTTPAHKDAAKTGWLHQYLPTSRLLLGESESAPWLLHLTSERQTMSEDQLDVFFAKSITHLWGQYTATLLGDIRKAQEAGLASILKAVLSPKKISRPESAQGLGSHEAYNRVHKFLLRQGSSNLLSTEKDFSSRYDADATLRRIVLDIDRIERQIEEASAPRKQLEELVTDLFSGGKSVQFTDQSIEIKTSSGSEIGIASLSSGEKHLLMILVDTLLAGESSIIIDEPEISMHVDWQKRLVQIMRILTPKAQIIIATHSPEVMADLPDSSIIRM